MVLDAWLPIGYELPGEAKVCTVVFEGANWQIYEIQGKGKALVARDEIVQRWINTGLIEPKRFISFGLGDQCLWMISCRPSQVLCPVAEGDSPKTKADALSFALAFRVTRDIDADSPLHDALYIEKISRLLPTYSISPSMGDDVVLGYWLTGGVNVSVKSFRRLGQAVSWLGATHLREVVQAAGFKVGEVMPTDRFCVPSKRNSDSMATVEKNGTCDESEVVITAFELAGRPDLSAFFNEHLIDIVQNRDRYKALGIEFPSAVVLHGPPGCGKTFAVERLVDFLGWPSFQIDASSVASPYIHETSKKVAEVFDTAMENAPSVLVIDEMEAFLADREMGGGHHRVEEVAEFLRRIPEATKNEVLIVAMTNRIDMIDPAILRRGRFDHVVKVDFASEAEVLSLLEILLSTLPKEEDVNAAPFARALAGRPLSDVVFVVREGARIAAREGRDKLDQGSLLTAMHATPARESKSDKQHLIGFIR